MGQSQCCTKAATDDVVHNNYTPDDEEEHGGENGEPTSLEADEGPVVEVDVATLTGDGDEMMMGKSPMGARGPPQMGPKVVVPVAEVEHDAPAEAPYPSELRAAFPPSVVGAYSCHGLKPRVSDKGEVTVVHKINQDAGIAVRRFATHPQQALFMICDGHGRQGAAAAAIAVELILGELEGSNELKDVEGMQTEQVDALFQQAFHEAHAVMCQNGQNWFVTSGTTATAVLLTPSRIFIANVGDSKAVCALQSIDTTKSEEAWTRYDLPASNHTPGNEDEYTRILHAGGHVQEISSIIRFIVPDPEGGPQPLCLALSRALGDSAFSTYGLLPTPDTFCVPSRLGNDEGNKVACIILASDGVWDFISEEEAVGLVTPKGSARDATGACRDLVAEAKKRWAEHEPAYRDDISATVILFESLLELMDSDAASDAIDHAAGGARSPLPGTIDAVPGEETPAETPSSPTLYTLEGSHMLDAAGAGRLIHPPSPLDIPSPMSGHGSDTPGSPGSPGSESGDYSMGQLMPMDGEGPSTPDPPVKSVDIAELDGIYRRVSITAGSSYVEASPILRPAAISTSASSTPGRPRCSSYSPDLDQTAWTATMPPIGTDEQ